MDNDGDVVNNGYFGNFLNLLNFRGRVERVMQSIARLGFVFDMDASSRWAL